MNTTANPFQSNIVMDLTTHFIPLGQGFPTSML
jgi:hypothetical protein